MLLYTNSFASNYCFCFQGNGIGEATGGRYRYIEDGATGGRYRNIDGYSVEKTRFTGTKASLYANGESVAVNRFSSNGDSSGRAYFGTDILGSVRSATSDGAGIEDRYEYDAFGTPYKGDFSTGLDGGYTGKPYDATTGLYNYGYRDYNPQTARFTTVDPIRDGNNWFSYVVNDPVNYVDLWGLSSSDADAAKENELLMVGIGVSAGMVISGGIEIGIVVSPDGIEDAYITVGGGTGVGASTSITGSANVTTTELENLHGSTGTTAQVAVGLAGNFDLDNGAEFTGISGIGVGGGVQETVTITATGVVEDIKDIAVTVGSFLQEVEDAIVEAIVDGILGNNGL